MDPGLIAARAANFAAATSVAGVFAFACFVALPAYRRAGTALPRPLVRAWKGLAAISLAIGVLSLAAWVFYVSRALDGAVGVVLLQTQFGRVALLRLALILVIATGVPFLGRRGLVPYLYGVLGAALVAAAAWQGHGGADIGGGGAIHLAADILHLIAVATWLGGLLPLALLLRGAIRAGDPGSALAARVAAGRFSILGFVCIGAVFLTGLGNTWFLAGSVPALVGTAYGRWLLAKLAVFGAIIAIAALNRYRLVPRLAVEGASRAAALGIARNAVIEAALGILIVAIVGVLGTLVPGLHQEPSWPFAQRFALDQIQADPALRSDAMGSAASALLGLLALGFGAYRRRAFLMAVGLALVAGFGWHAVDLVLVPATPTSYAVSPQPFSAEEIAAGYALYRRNCVACHGQQGRGDGPLASALPVAPADLTAHLFMHTEGDLYSFVKDGLDGGVMPGFAARLDDGDRWRLVAFLEAQAAAAQAGLAVDWASPSSFADQLGRLAPHPAVGHVH